MRRSRTEGGLECPSDLKQSGRLVPVTGELYPDWQSVGRVAAWDRDDWMFS